MAVNNRSGAQSGRSPSAVVSVILIVFYVAVAISYSVMIPAGEGVDETPHFEYVRYVKEQRALPVQPMHRAEGVVVWMGHHPPLYYVLSALAISWSDLSDFDQVLRPNPHFIWQENVGDNGWNVLMHFGQDDLPWQRTLLALHVVRLMTVFLGALALFAVYRAARLMFPDQPWVAPGVLAIMGLNPSYIFMTSTIHHDTLQTAIFTLAIWWALKLQTGEERRGFFMLGGILLAAAMLTKLSGLALVGVVALAILLASRTPWRWRTVSCRMLLAFGPALVLAGWWYARNILLYGDPLGWRMFLAIHNHMVRAAPYSWRTFVDEFLGQIGRTFWGAFGYMHITFPEVSRYLWWLGGLAGFGLLLALLRRQLKLRRSWAYWTVALSLLLLLFLSFLRFSIATVGAGHGRYLFPAGFTNGVLLLTGLNGFLGWRRQREVALLLTVAMAIYAVWLPLRFVMPKYAPPTSVERNELPGGTRLVDLPIAPGVNLSAYRLSAERVVPGQAFSVRLYWQATGSDVIREDPRVRVELIDESGGVYGRDEFWPVPGLSPDVWSAEFLYVSDANLEVPGQLLPGRLQLAVTPLFAGNWQQAEGSVQPGDLVPITELMSAGGAVIVEDEQVPVTREERFASEIQLIASNLSATSLHGGEILVVDLYWRVLTEPAADYTVFVHLLRDGELIAQFDRPAGGGRLPTSAWLPGQTLLDSYPLTIPEDAPAGRYLITTGMYAWPSLVRLPVTVNGSATGDSVALGEIEVLPQKP